MQFILVLPFLLLPMAVIALVPRRLLVPGAAGVLLALGAGLWMSWQSDAACQSDSCIGTGIRLGFVALSFLLALGTALYRLITTRSND